MVANQLRRVDVARHLWTHPDGRRTHVYGDTPPTTTDRQLVDAPDPSIHLRHDPLLDEWVAVTPKRSERPGGWRDDREAVCPLCPGGAELPFRYLAAAFENRFPTFSVGARAPEGPGFADAHGLCEVIVFTQRHDATFADLSAEEVGLLLAVWRDRSEILWETTGVQHVMLFENAGAEVGATLDHPHGQAYAFPVLPPLVERRLSALDRHRAARRSCLHCDLIEDVDRAPRVVVQDDFFDASVPFAPRWPFEVHVRARRHGLGRLSELDDSEQRSLGSLLIDVRRRLDLVLGRRMPVMTCILEAPHGGEDWHLTVELYPVLRDEGRLKLRAGVETATGLTILDRIPEDTAAELRALSPGAVIDPPVVTVRAQAHQVKGAE